MIREHIVAQLRACAVSLGEIVGGTQWHLFGSVDRNEVSASDIDLMIFCVTDDQADSIRRAIDCDAFLLPLDLSIMTYEEAADIDAAELQISHIIFE